MKKKLLSLVLATAMVVSVFAGCGAKEAAPAEETTTEATTETTEEAPATDAADEEIVTITYCPPSNTATPNDKERVLEKINEYTREKIGVEINWVDIPVAEFEDRIGNMIMAGEDWDVTYSSSWLNPYANNVAQGAFYKLDDLLETEAGKTLQESLPLWVIEAARIGDGIYAIPENCYWARQNGFQVQTEILDAYVEATGDTTYQAEVELESFDDFMPLLTWIKENTDKIPMFEREWLNQATWSRNKEGLANNTLFLDYETMTVKTFWEYEDVMESYELMNSLYKEGYIRSDALEAAEGASSDRSAGMYACNVCWYKPSMGLTVQNQYGYPCTVIPFGETYVYTGEVQSTQLVVNAMSEHPEKAFEFIVLLHTDEYLYNLIKYGEEGVDYNKIDDRHIAQVENVAYNRAVDGGVFGNEYLGYLSEGAIDDSEYAKNAVANAVQSPFMGFTFSQDDVTAEMANITTAYNEHFWNIMVASDLDAALESYKTALIDAGIETVQAEIQAQVDAWLAQ